MHKVEHVTYSIFLRIEDCDEGGVLLYSAKYSMSVALKIYYVILPPSTQASHVSGLISHN